MIQKKKTKFFIISANFFNDLGKIDIKPIQIENKINEIVEKKTEDIQTIRVVEDQKQLPKPTPIDNSPKVSAFSLSSIKAKKALQDSIKPIVYDESNLPKESFTEEQMILHWKNYAKKLGDSGQKIMESLLNINTPTLNEAIINYELPNEGSKIDFETQAPPLLSFLKNQLKNFSIEINVVVNEKVEQKFAFTPQDKFNRLNQINPNIEILKRTFDLDF